MLGHLQVIAGPDRGRSFPLAAGQTLVVGRGPNTATKLQDPQVSRVHCQVQVADGRIHLFDNGSGGGTLVNGQKVTDCVLQPGDLVLIGETTLQVVAPLPHDAGAEAGAGQPQRSPEPQPEPVRGGAAVGTTVSHYSIESVLAQGRSGIVYRARDARDGRTVAFKILGPEYAPGEEEYQRFLRVVKTVIGLRHANLVAVYGAGRSGGHCWIAMEFIDGESLARVIQRIGLVNMLDWRYALTVAGQITRALEAAHAEQIIHRNITPENILIRRADNVAKLGDLILAKALDEMATRQVTRPGQILGDLAYLPPERVVADEAVDTRADIYSLGATVYALLTGHPPIVGTSMIDTIRKIQTVEPAKPKKYQLSVPDQFQDIVLKTLEKRPEDRYQTPSELLKDLIRCAKFQGMTF